jgi:hypothetical protein
MLFLSWEAIGFSVEQSRSACVNWKLSADA